MVSLHSNQQQEVKATHLEEGAVQHKSEQGQAYGEGQRGPWYSHAIQCLCHWS